MDATRAMQVRSGIRIEVITVIWMVIEMAVSIGAGLAAGSILLIAFGMDSLIELISGGILLWRLQVESKSGKVKNVEQAEHRAAYLITCAFTLQQKTLPSALASRQRPCWSCPGWPWSNAA